MPTVSLTIKTDKGTEAFGAEDRLNAVKGLVAGISSGALKGSVTVQTAAADPVAASATLTLTSAVATDAITIGTVTLTASSTPADEDEFEIDGADDDADATALADAINAHSTLSKVVSASATDNVVTVTCLVKGVIGNQLPISSADATIVASGSFLSGGTGGPSGAQKLFAR